MADVKKIATRESYGNALKELAEEFPNLVVLDADLAAATKTGIFKKAYPDRHIDCGIAESNMMGIAAGLATVGKIPFASSFAMFAAGRAFEQVRNSIGYPHLNVKIGATHAGISVGEDGATHQCNEDLALMRTIPGMVVMCPSDDVEAKAAVRAALEYEGPVYIRFGRAAVPVINDRPEYHFEIGKGDVVKEGKDVTIVATGICVDSALGAAELLKAEGIDAEVVNICTIKPLDEELIVNFLDVVENHKMVVENSGLLTVAALKHLNCKDKRVVSILSGGNMDIITMSSVVQHGLIERGRVFTVSVQLPDRPGELVNVANVIAQLKGNVIRLEHNQFVSINRNAAVELKITLEAFGHEHKQQIVDALKEKGYDPKLENPTSLY
mgnify:CR=1 FL=1